MGHPLRHARHPCLNARASRHGIALRSGDVKNSLLLRYRDERSSLAIHFDVHRVSPDRGLVAGHVGRVGAIDERTGPDVEASEVQRGIPPERPRAWPCDSEVLLWVQVSLMTWNTPSTFARSSRSLLATTSFISPGCNSDTLGKRILLRHRRTRRTVSVRAVWGPGSRAGRRPQG